LKPQAVPDTLFLVEHFQKGIVQEALLNFTRYYPVSFSSVVLMELLAGAIDSRGQKFVYEISRNFIIISVYQLSSVNGLLAARSE
jgi:predicted nucleic acid-binding protein